MKGADLKKLKEELGLNDQAMARIGGLLNPRVLLEAYANQEKYLETLSMFPLLACDLFHEIWSVASDMNPDEKKQYGLKIAKDLHTHGAGYTAWSILDSRCSSYTEF